MNNEPNPLNEQVGGNHYKSFAIQPYVFFHANNTPHHKACVIRRILRYDNPTGHGAMDLNKIVHECELNAQLDGFGPLKHQVAIARLEEKIARLVAGKKWRDEEVLSRKLQDVDEDDWKPTTEDM